MTNEGRIELFNVHRHCVYFEDLIDKSMLESKQDTWVILFYLRDPRGGRGERDLFRRAWQHILNKEFSKKHVYALMELVGDYGRYDDLCVISTMKGGRHAMSVIKQTLAMDMENLALGSKVSLLAKWMPTENGSIDKKTKFVERYTKYTGITRREYRDTNKTLRTHLRTVIHSCSSNYKFKSLGEILTSERYEDVVYKLKG